MCVGERCNASGRRLLLALDEGTVCAVPPQWTDLVAPDPEVVLGEARAVMRVGDLIELARLVARLGATHGTRPRACQANCAANVN